MITEFILQNKSSNKSVKFGMNIDCDYLYSEDGGIDWGNVPAEHNTYSYPNQFGSTISNTKIQNRDITITGFVFYVLSDDERSLYPREEWQSYAYNKMKDKKGVLNTLINPQDYVRLTIGNYYIEGKPSATPKYGITDEDNNVYFCEFMIEIFCDNPMFRKIIESQTILSGDTGTLHFPFIIEPDDYIFGTRINYLMLIVENEGNAKIGGKITLLAKGVIQNPEIENISTGETIKINKTMQPGEKIIINTSDGEAKGIVGIYNGVESDYLQYWDFENDWFKFDPGTNVIGYSTENQSETYLEIFIDLNPEKYGLEDM